MLPASNTYSFNLSADINSSAYQTYRDNVRLKGKDSLCRTFQVRIGRSPNHGVNEKRKEEIKDGTLKFPEKSKLFLDQTIAHYACKLSLDCWIAHEQENVHCAG